MENASKALLIAAAVLIVILIIAFGMSVFNSTGDTSGQAEDLASSQQMQTFNAQFTGYLGNNRSGSMVRNLKVVVNNSNARNSQHPVELAGADTLVDNNVYKVTAEYGNDGYITKITVQ